MERRLDTMNEIRASLAVPGQRYDLSDQEMKTGSMTTN